jgi:hypothetical protein
MELRNAVGGLAGACALTLINQGVAKFDKNAPRLDLLGMNAVAKFAKPKLPVVNSLFPIALGGDLVSNSLYYAMAKGDTKQSTYLRGALLGLGAGLGAITLPQRLGMASGAVSRKPRTKVMTVAWYVIGGLVAAAAINLLNKNGVSRIDT